MLWSTVLNYLYRSQFRDALAAHIDPEYTHFNKRCISITSDPSTKVQTIHFTDGTTAEADVVLVANGIKSSIRDALVANGTGLGLDVSRNAFKCASFSNSICYRGLVYRENAEALGVDTSMWQRPMLLIGQDKVTRYSSMYSRKHSKIVCSTLSCIPSKRVSWYVHGIAPVVLMICMNYYRSTLSPSNPNIPSRSGPFNYPTLCHRASQRLSTNFSPNSLVQSSATMSLLSSSASKSRPSGISTSSIRI